MELGKNVKYRRRLLRMSQARLSGNRWTRSYMSQIEQSHAVPGLDALQVIATGLNCTIGDLLGHQVYLQAAKLTILRPPLCHRFLDLLPAIPTTTFLRQLTTAVTKHTPPAVPKIRDMELYLLTAKVLIHQGDYSKAVTILHQSLEFCQQHQRWQALSLQATALEKMGDETGLAVCRQHLADAMSPPNDEFLRGILELTAATNPNQEFCASSIEEIVHKLTQTQCRQDNIEANRQLETRGK